MKLNEKQIERIADDLDCGMKCFYNPKTGDIKSVPDFDILIGCDEEPWQEEFAEIEENSADFIEFLGLKSHESFEIMVDFAETIDDTELKNKLIDALNRPKPFRKFKSIIDNSDNFRQQWFDFKKLRLIQWVKEQIDLKSEEINE
ncbi:MAG: UPF0158 family protein [Candidatus Rifleibacteriota bacterium]